jgi:hypothetical protein
MLYLIASCAIADLAANPSGGLTTGVIVGSNLTLFTPWNQLAIIFFPTHAAGHSHTPPYFALTIDTVLFLTWRDPSTANASHPIKSYILDQMPSLSSRSTNIDAGSGILQLSTTSISEEGGPPVLSSYTVGKVIIIPV